MINSIQNHSFLDFRGRRINVKNKSNLAKRFGPKSASLSQPERKEVNPIIRSIKAACSALYLKIGKEPSPRVPIDIHPEGAGDVFLSCTKPRTIAGTSSKNVIKVSVHGPDEKSSSGAFVFLKEKGSLSKIKKVLKNPNTPKEIDKAVTSLTEGINRASSSEAKDII